MRRRNFCGARLRPALVFATTGLLLASVLPADDVTVQNDSIRDFGNAAIQAGFVATERAAAWLTAICAGDLKAVQVLWMSVTGGSVDILGDSVTISDPGAFPTPGSELLKLDGPVLSDGFFNEYPVPVPIAVAEGQEFVVDFKFLYDANPIVGPSVVTDVVGCQPSKNSLFALPGLWVDSCLLGLSGDFAIRAVIDCPVPPVFLNGFDYGDTGDWDTTRPAVP